MSLSFRYFLSLAMVASLAACGGAESGPDATPSPPPDVGVPPVPGDAKLALFVGSAGGGGMADGPALLSRFKSPTQVVVDADGTRFVADTANHLIRRIGVDGMVTTLAGKAGAAGSEDGIGSSARFRYPTGLALDGQGALYIADTYNHTVRKLRLSDSQVSTVAGVPGVPGAGSGGGAGQLAKLKHPIALAFMDGSLLIADSGNHAIRRLVEPQLVVPYAGTVGQSGPAQGTQPAHLANFTRPTGLAVVAASGGAESQLLVIDSGNCVVRWVSHSSVGVLAGQSGDCRSVDGPLGQARLDLSEFAVDVLGRPGGIAVDAAGRIFVADKKGLVEVASNGSVRTVSLARADQSGSTAPENEWFSDRLGGLAFDTQGRLLFAHRGAHTIGSVELTGPATGEVATLAGQPSGSAEPLFDIQLGEVWSMSLDKDGNLLVGSGTWGAGTSFVKRITGAGAVETLSQTTAPVEAGVRLLAQAASGVRYEFVARNYSVDFDPSQPTGWLRAYRNGQLKFNMPSASADSAGDPASGAAIDEPTAIDVDSLGRAVIAEPALSTVRRVSEEGVVTLVAGRPGVFGSQTGDALDTALFSSLTDVAVAANDDIFVLDGESILKIAPLNGRDVVSLVASNLEGARSLAVDEAGNLYVSRGSPHCTILRIRPNAEQSVIAGQPGLCSFVPGGLPGGLVIDDNAGPGRLKVRNNRLVMHMDNGIVEISSLPH